jgi:predicted cupin superfamily sugar epimerase
MDSSTENFKSRSQTSGEAERLIELLQLTRHPEGGWYRETWRSNVRVGERAAGSAIFFLLEEGQRSQWHRVDADEFWLWHAGSALHLGVANADGGSARRVVLGPEALSGEEPQLLIPAGHWQTANAVNGWALVSCMVIPGFEFAGFTMASQQTADDMDIAIGVS